MTKALVFTTLAAALLATAIPADAGGSASGGGTIVSGHRDRVLMRRKTVRRSSRGTGTGIVTGGKPTATGGTPGGMPDRQ